MVLEWDLWMFESLVFLGTRYPPSGHLQTPLTSPRFHTSPPLGTSEMRPPTISPTVGTASQNAQQVPIMQQHGGIQPGAIQSGRQQQIQIFGGPQPVQSGAAISQVQHQQFMRMPFIGHETQLIAQGAHGARYSPEICLAGCVFLIIDDFSPSLVDRNAMCSVIRFHGGDVEQFGMRGIPDRVTHLVCSTVAHSEIIANQATIERRKRLVTIQWLSETIMNKRMDAPTKPCHLPTCWAENSKPAVGKLITVAGFDDVETSNLKWMISAIGARYTPTLTAHNQILISKGCSGSLNLSNLMPKIEKAKQLGVAVVNFQWIVEQYFGNTRGLNDLANPMYSPMNALSNFENCSSLALERMFDFCAKLLFAWKFAIPLNEEIINMALELKKNVENDKSVFPHRQFKCSLNDAPSEEQIAESLEILKTADKLPKSDVLVYFEGLLPLQIECMSRKIRFLGGKVAESVEQCTHFVVPNLERTAKLVEALALGKAVISPEWIQNCFSLLKIVDAYDFFVRDIENERKYGYNLKDTILKARYRRDVTFHLSANVRPTYEILSQLIIAGGGRVEKERPTKKKLAKCIEVDDTYLIVVNESDLHLYQYLITCNFPLFTEDFVWMSIIRHKMDFTPTNYMIPPQVLRPHLSQTQPAILAQAPQSVPNPTPAKKSGGSRPGAIKQERISLKAS
ncbi:regulator of ty1 transposition protein BRCT domain-containing protein [Ditylenchus destructor]|nr:regulator of ty1 transposition protein BRCT domain-containing protein [Ditylenchus destructor]